MNLKVTGQRPPQQIPTTAPARDPNPFKTFYSQFSKAQQKQFQSNMIRHFTHIINRNLRKMKEASQRLKESIRR